jgi:tetratricopeptide (TPR) repeat protein
MASAAALDRAALLRLARTKDEAADRFGALAALQTVLEGDPEDHDALRHLATLCLKLGDPTAAEQTFRRLLAAHPDDMAAWIELSVTLRRQRRSDEALACCCHVLDTAPAHREALLNLALALDAAGDGMAALQAFDRLLAHHPDDPLGLLELVYFHRRRDRFDEALAAAGRLLDAHPDLALGWVARGSVLFRLERFDEAEDCFRRALARQADLAPAHFSLGFTLLLRGFWQEGLEEFEWRRHLPARVPPPVDAPDWTGGFAPPGSRILLWNEQGFGDGIQYLRFVPLLIERGYRPVLVLSKELLRLARSLPGEVAILGAGDPLPPVDYQVPLGSLPHRFGLLSPDGTWRAPYLSAAGPAPSLARGKGFSVGLVWAGAAIHDNDARRSLRLGDLAPLVCLPDIAWYSLQVGPRAGDLAAAPFASRIVDLAPQIHDFADTAALLDQLDLLISVDTSIIHLAGAMARPVWVLLPRPADWRWLAEGERSGWYPTMRLFRQTIAGDWGQVVAAVAVALAAL